jgi:hypothetical protein
LLSHCFLFRIRRRCLHTQIGAWFQGETVIPIGPFSTSEKLAGDGSARENFKRTDRHCSNAQLRGLAPLKYRVVNYETGDVLGSVNGRVADLLVTFTRHLLLKAVPQ